MARKFWDVKLIGSGLMVLYATSFFIYLQSFRISTFQIHATVLCGIFLLSFLATLGIIQHQKWGRKLILWTSLLTALYGLALNMALGELVPMSYVFMAVIVFLFFSQSRIRVLFETRKEGDWKSILVVDDDEILIRTVRPILISNGYAVLTANTGEEGLRIIKKQRPDLILLDVILPGIKGRDVCRTIKDDKSMCDIPVIFLTAKDSPDDIKAEMIAGAEAHLTKPVNPKELISMVRSVFGRRK